MEGEATTNYCDGRGQRREEKEDRGRGQDFGCGWQSGCARGDRSGRKGHRQPDRHLVGAEAAGRPGAPLVVVSEGDDDEVRQVVGVAVELDLLIFLTYPVAYVIFYY